MHSRAYLESLFPLVGEDHWHIPPSSCLYISLKVSSYTRQFEFLIECFDGSARDFSKQILIDLLITDFVQLARGSFSLSVVRVKRVWFRFWRAIHASQMSFM